MDKTFDRLIFKVYQYAREHGGTFVVRDIKECERWIGFALEGTTRHWSIVAASFEFSQILRPWARNGEGRGRLAEAITQGTLVALLTDSYGTSEPEPANDISDRFTEGMMTAGGFDDAIIGVVAASAAHEEAVAYDYDRCIQILVDRDNMTWEDAVEFFEYNVLGAFVGPNTPLFLHMGGLDE